MTDRKTEVIIAAVALPPPLHGQSIVSEKVVNALGAAGVNVRVIDVSPGKLTRNLSYHVRRVCRILQTLLALAAHSRYHRKTIYMVAQAGRGVFYSLLIVAASRLLNYRIILHHHSRAYLRQKTFLHGILIKGVGLGGTQVVLSEKMRDELTTQYAIPYRSCIVASNACHIDASVKPGNMVTGSTLKIGLLSNLNKEKGLDLAIATVCAAVDRGHDVSLILAGPIVGKNAEESVALAQQALGARIKVLGLVEGAAKDGFFEAIDVFLFPSMYRDEAQPLVLLEAMSFGIPLIVSDHGYIREAIGGAAVVLPTDETFVAHAVGTIANWINDKDALNRSGKNAKEHFDKLYRASLQQFSELLKCVG